MILTNGKNEINGLSFSEIFEKNFGSLATLDSVENYKKFLDPCECDENEVCPACMNYGENNLIFTDGDDVRFFKVNEKVINTFEKRCEYFIKFVFIPENKGYKIID